MAQPQTPTLSGADPSVGATITRVALIGTHSGGNRRERAEIELDELEELARTLGAEVVDRRLLQLREPHPATYLRTGTVETLDAALGELDHPAVLVNNSLTPRQQRNLQAAWKVPVLDRTEVILAIFARRARTAEGRIQVEMAQLEHLLPGSPEGGGTSSASAAASGSAVAPARPRSRSTAASSASG